MKANKPTKEFYDQLQSAYEHFNCVLFDGALPHCLITVQREKNTMGFFSPSRWSSPAIPVVHEISLNPTHFANRRMIEIFQTLVHEQCHVWQHEFGSPSRPGYHNQEWAQKMELIGLMPSSTGVPNGKKTGQKMSDYVIPEGRFEKACIELVKKGYQFNWVDRRTTTKSAKHPLENQFNRTSPRTRMSRVQSNILESPVSLFIPNFKPDSSLETSKSRQKTKYHCPCCGTNIWGKPSLNIRCEECSKSFVQE